MTGKAIRRLGSSRQDLQAFPTDARRLTLEHRICYIAKFEEAIYVLHAFEKRTRKTSQRDLNLAKQRYQMLLAQR